MRQHSSRWPVDLRAVRAIQTLTLLIEVWRRSRSGRVECHEPWTGGSRVLHVSDVVLRFGGVTALDEVSLTVARQRDLRADRAERGRQDLAVQLRDPDLPPDAGFDHLRRHRSARAASRPDRPQGGRQDVPEPGAVRDHDRHGEHHGRRALPRHPAPVPLGDRLADRAGVPAATGVRGLVPVAGTRPHRRRPPRRRGPAVRHAQAGRVGQGVDGAAAAAAAGRAGRWA